MGKGRGGCVPSKKRAPISDPKKNHPVSIESQAPESASQERAIQIQTQTRVRKLSVFIVFYSMYGHVESLPGSVKKGVDSVEGVLYRVPETLRKEVLELMKVPEKDNEVPFISADKLIEGDGFLFGFPMRFGRMAAQMKSFFDSTGQLWKKQKLAGIPAGFFVTTSGRCQETTASSLFLNHLPLDSNHSISPPWNAFMFPLVIPLVLGMLELDSIRGGSPDGAGAFVGDGARQPSETELTLAEHQGKYMAMTFKKIAYQSRNPPTNRLLL